MQVRRVDMFPAGDRIVPWFTPPGAERASRGEIDVEFRTAHVTTFSGGKVVDWQVFDTQRAAFEAAGLDPDAPGDPSPKRANRGARRPRRRRRQPPRPPPGRARPASRTPSSPLASAAAKAAASPASTPAFAMCTERSRSGSSTARSVAAPSAMSRPPAILAIAIVAAEWSLNPSPLSAIRGASASPTPIAIRPAPDARVDRAHVGRDAAGERIPAMRGIGSGSYSRARPVDAACWWQRWRGPSPSRSPERPPEALAAGALPFG